MKQNFLQTGKIVGTHGVKGAVKVQSWSDSGEFFKNFKTFYLDASGEKSLIPERVQPGNTTVIIKFKDTDDIASAEALREKLLYVARTDCQLEAGQYFISELIGCTVTDADTNASLGTITDVSRTGANDVWHITRDGKEFLVPAIKDIIISVDIDTSAVVLRPMKGIFDDEN